MQRTSVSDLPTGPKDAGSTVLTVEGEAVIIAFRRPTLLPPDDCLHALQPAIPHLTRSSLHRCLQRHGISRLPEVEGQASPKRKFKPYPIGYFHLDSAEARTAAGKLSLLVAIDRTSKFAFVERRETVSRRNAADFLRRLLRRPIEAVPYEGPRGFLPTTEPTSPIPLATPGRPWKSGRRSPTRSPSERRPSNRPAHPRYRP